MAAMSSCARAFASLECRSIPSLTRRFLPPDRVNFPITPDQPAFAAPWRLDMACGRRSSGFPPNFVRQLSTKARRNYDNLGVAQVAAASWSTDQGASDSPVAAVVASIKVEATVEEVVGLGDDDAFSDGENVKVQGSPSSEYTLFLNSDGSVAIHTGERLGGGIVTNAIITPVVNTSAYFFKKNC